MEEKSRQERKYTLAEEVVALARASLVVRFRFMEGAVLKLGLSPVSAGSVSTDGAGYYYEPGYILNRYRQGRDLPARDYLHSVMHCIFRHMYVSSFIHTKHEQRCWSLACDIMTENVIEDMWPLSGDEERKEERRKLLERYRAEVKPFTAEKLYRYFMNADLPYGEMNYISSYFEADDHSRWFPKDDKDGSRRGKDSPDVPEPNAPPMENEQGWRDIAESIEEDLKTFSKEAGESAGEMMKALKNLNREHRDLGSFIRAFMTRGEVMKQDPAEFDYIYYTYGLRLYKKMPLIEPLEYREEERIRSFVIAIDTSGSVSEELVTTFLRRVYGILSSEGSFFSRSDIHIIQCDARVQSDIHITRPEEFEEYIKGMEIKGFGGTDFRPVFEYVDRLRAGGELRDLKGLIYFTDGWGMFPEAMPDYHTAFVFIEDEDNNYELPVWAAGLVIGEDEITEEPWT